jgi:Second Messenger Oligonucleotide or Dinucleotide Synthetase domain
VSSRTQTHILYSEENPGVCPMTVGQRFSDFLTNLKLTPAQQADGETKFKGVTKCLNRHYYGSDSETSHGKLVGSWGKKTRIRPPRYVDVMFVLPDAIFTRYAAMSSLVNKQSQLLQEVKGVLLKCYPNTKMRGDGQVVVVPFTSYEVELVPAFATGSQFLICNTNGGGRYKTVDPDSEITMIDYYDKDSSGNTRDLVRMMKRWQEYCSVPIKSFWIELLAETFVRDWQYKGKSTTWYDYMARDFFAYMINKENGYVFVHGTSETINIGNAWKSRAQTAYDRAVKACSLETTNSDSAGEEWQKIFGLDIPRT